MQLTTKRSASFLYLCLRFLIIPTPRGCNRDVVFLGGKKGLMLVLYTLRVTCGVMKEHNYFRFDFQSSLYDLMIYDKFHNINMFYVSMISLFIHALLFEK